MKFAAMIVMVVGLVGCSEGGLGGNPGIFLAKMAEGSLSGNAESPPAPAVASQEEVRRVRRSAPPSAAPTRRMAVRALPPDMGIW